MSHTIRLTISILLLGVLTTAIAAAPMPPPVVNLVALNSTNTLLLFRSDRGNQVRQVTVKNVEGTLLGIDVRPADGKVYALSTANILYTIDTQSGSATKVSQLTLPFEGGVASGFDFNPQADRLRLVAANGQDMRVSVDVGAVAIDGTLRYAADDTNVGKSPSIVGAAYTNSVKAAATTVLFNVDQALDVLVKQDPPNDGVLRTVGKLGIKCTTALGFDMTRDAAGKDHAFALCQRSLYSIDLLSGKAALLGKVTADQDIIGLAIIR